MARITPCLENGKIARYQATDSNNVAHGSTEFIVIRGRSQVTDNDFAYYLTQWEKVRNYAIGQMTGTSGRQRVPTDSLNHLMVPVPPLSEQRWISDVLGVLDDKIEVNRRMNETLEEVARALFTSWFVDFDPVHAKAAVKHHSPLEGESARQGRKPAAAPVGGLHRLYSPRTLQRAKTLRQNQTDAEGLLWHFLRNRQLDGYKFRRQQPIGPYIADFACLSEKLLIELDGSHHAERSSHDEARDRYLRDRGYRVLRVWNNDVFGDCFGVLERIHAALVPPPHQPSPDGSASATPPQGGSDGSKWSMERARAYLNRMDPEIANLFPDSFVNSQLGKIPEGWEVSEIGKEVDAVGGATPSTKEPACWDEGKWHWATPKDLSKLLSPVLLETERKITDAGIRKISSGLLPRGTVLLSSRAPIGYLAITETPTAVNQGFIAMVCKKRLPNVYVLFWCYENLEYIKGISGGSTFAEISKKVFRPIPVTVPSASILTAYEGIVRPIFSRIVANISENRTLAQTRDLLLPKLISGEIRAPKSAQ